MARRSRSRSDDGSYRRLFSHARMVEDLIRRYVSPPWLDRLDFSTLEMVLAHYLSDELEQRESDVVWRLRYGPAGEWFYVYLLIEFQSSVDRFMAVRVLTYLMLLYEDLILKKRLTRSGMLPPVVPIVLYTEVDGAAAGGGADRVAARLRGSSASIRVPGDRRRSSATGAVGAARQSGGRSLPT